MQYLAKVSTPVGYFFILHPQTICVFYWDLGKRPIQVVHKCEDGKRKKRRIYIFIAPLTITKLIVFKNHSTGLCNLVIRGFFVNTGERTVSQEQRNNVDGSGRKLDQGLI